MLVSEWYAVIFRAFIPKKRQKFVNNFLTNLGCDIHQHIVQDATKYRLMVEKDSHCVCVDVMFQNENGKKKFKITVGHSKHEFPT